MVLAHRRHSGPTARIERARELLLCNGLMCSDESRGANLTGTQTPLLLNCPETSWFLARIEKKCSGTRPVLSKKVMSNVPVPWYQMQN